MSVETKNLPISLSADQDYRFITPSNAKMQVDVAKSELGSYRRQFQQNVVDNAELNMTVIPPAGMMNLPNTRCEIVVDVKKADNSPLTIANLKSKLGANSFPIPSIINRSECVQNGFTYTSYPAQESKEVSYEYNRQLLYRISDASHPDQNTKYDSDYLNDPLRWSQDVINQNESRGFGSQYPVQDVVPPPDANTVRLTITFVDRLWNKMFPFMETHPNPIENCTQFEVRLFLGSLSQMFKGQKIDGQNLTFTFNSIQLWFDYTVEKPQLNVSAPSKYLFGSQDRILLPETPAQAIPANQTIDVQLPSQHLQGFPEQWEYYVLRNADPNDTNQPDQYLPVVGLDLTVNNRQSLLKDYTPQQLYDITSRNGFNGRYGQFAGLVQDMSVIAADRVYGNGSRIILKPSDLALGENGHGGVDLPFNITSKLTIFNPTNAQVNASTYTVYFVYKYGAINTVSEGVISHSRLLMAPGASHTKDKLVYKDDEVTNSIVGGRRGGFLGKLWSGVKRVAPAISKIVRNLPVLDQYVGDDTAVGSVANALGAGVIRVAGKKASSKKSGGKRMSSKALLDKLMM